MGTKTLDRSSGAAKEEGPKTIDPRIRARRIGVQRDEGRSRLGKLMVVLGLLAIVAASVAALRSPLLDVDHVVVVGAKRTSAEAIVAASGVRRRTSMGDVALGPSSRRVADLAWVRRATVRREWPGTVRITVTERRPLAQIRSGAGGWLLIDRAGRLLARVSGPKTGIVELTGVEAAGPGSWLDAAFTDALGVAESLPADLRSQVAGVGRDGRGTSLRLSDGLAVGFGGGEDRGAKVEALRTLLAQPDRPCFASIYLGVASAPALTRHPGCG